MNDYNRDHYRFRRQSGLHSYDFRGGDRPRPTVGDGVALVFSIFLLVLLMIGVL